MTGRKVRMKYIDIQEQENLLRSISGKKTTDSAGVSTRLLHLRRWFIKESGHCCILISTVFARSEEGDGERCPITSAMEQYFSPERETNLRAARQIAGKRRYEAVGAASGYWIRLVLENNMDIELIVYIFFLALNKEVQTEGFPNTAKTPS